MHSSSRITGLALFLMGGALLAWLLYDATSVQAALGLDGLASEGAVALVGPLVGVAALCAGLVCWRRGRRHAAIESAV